MLILGLSLLVISLIGFVAGVIISLLKITKVIPWPGRIIGLIWGAAFLVFIISFELIINNIP